MEETPADPRQVIEIFLASTATDGKSLVGEACAKINAALMEICLSDVKKKPLTRKQPVLVSLDNMTRAAALEVLLGYREKGWHVSLTDLDKGSCVFSFTIPMT